MEEGAGRHVCPWWIGYLLLCPIRRLGQSPEKVLGPYLRPGMTALDVGCAMGYFTLAMARLVGAGGRVVAVDVQPRMIRTLERRARRAGLDQRVETRLCQPSDLGLDDLVGSVDFALAFAVVHEVPDARALLHQIRAALRADGRLLIAEPTGHVKADAFETTVATAVETGFEELERPKIRKSHTALLVKTTPRD